MCRAWSIWRPGVSDPVRTAERPFSRPWTVQNLFVTAVGFTTDIAAVIVASSCRSNPEAAGARPAPSVASINIGGGSAEHARTTLTSNLGPADGFESARIAPGWGYATDLVQTDLHTLLCCTLTIRDSTLGELIQ